MKKQFIMAATLLLLAVGCSQETGVLPVGEGTGRAAFVCNVSSAVGVTRVETRELPMECIPSEDDLRLEIKGANGETMSYASMSEYDQPLLKEGSYTATLSYGDPDGEGADKACFEGGCRFTVVARKTITEQVPVELVNSVFSLKFSEWFRKYYSEYSVTLRTESGFQGGYIGSASMPLVETVPIFAKPGTRLYFSGTATKTNGAQVAFPETEIGITVARTWHTVNINADQVGQAGIVVSLDGTPTAIEEIPVELNPDA